MANTNNLPSEEGDESQSPDSKKPSRNNPEKIYDRIEAKIGDIIDLSGLWDDGEPSETPTMNSPIILSEASASTSKGYNAQNVADLVSVLFLKPNLRQRVTEKKKRYVDRIASKGALGRRMFRERCLIAIIDALLSESGMAVKVDLLVQLKSECHEEKLDDVFDEAIFNKAYQEMMSYCDFYKPSAGQLSGRAKAGTPVFGFTQEEWDDRNLTADLKEKRQREKYEKAPTTESDEEDTEELDFSSDAFKKTVQDLQDSLDLDFPDEDSSSDE